MGADRYPEQRTCRERRQEWFRFDCTFIDFGNGADVTPRYHILAEVGGDLGQVCFSGDDPDWLLEDAAGVLFIIRRGIDAA